MTDLSDTDRKLLALLRQDARASVTTLSGMLGLARGTVQKRLAQLIADGTIRKFTIELGGPDSDDRVRAVMMIELQGPLARAVIAQLKKLPQVVSLFSTNGAWDLVAHLETGSLSEFDQTLRQVREIKGVSNSETCLLLDREW